MRVVDIVKQATRQDFRTEDGDPALLELDLPLSDTDIEIFETRITCALPDDIRELLGLCKGFVGGPVDTYPDERPKRNIQEEEVYAIRRGDIIGCPPGGAETAHQIRNTGPDGCS